MQEILSRMSAFDCVDIFVFPDDTIVNIPVEDWPICDCLISFYSKGFPLEKAIEYAKLRKPFSLNDLEMQFALLDRFVNFQWILFQKFFFFNFQLKGCKDIMVMKREIRYMYTAGTKQALSCIDARSCILKSTVLEKVRVLYICANVETSFPGLEKLCIRVVTIFSIGCYREVFI